MTFREYVQLEDVGKASVRMLTWLKWAEFLVLLKERGEWA